MPWYVCIKNIRGNRYYYKQRTWREGPSVKCHSVYLGPVGHFTKPPSVFGEGGVGWRGPSERTLARLHEFETADGVARGRELASAAVAFDSPEAFIASQGAVFYHTTDKVFERFDGNFLGTQTGAVAVSTDMGFHFVDKLENIEAFKRALANGVTNWGGEVLEARDVSGFRTIEKVVLRDKLINIHDPERLTVAEAEVLLECWGSESGEPVKGLEALEMAREVMETMEYHMDLADTFDEIKPELIKRGYEGVITSFGGDEDAFVIFDPNKFRSPAELKEIWQQSVGDKRQSVRVAFSEGQLAGLAKSARGDDRDLFVRRAMQEAVAYRGEPIGVELGADGVEDGTLGRGVYLVLSRIGAESDARPKVMLDAEGRYLGRAGHEMGQVKTFVTSKLKLLELSWSEEFQRLVDETVKGEGVGRAEALERVSAKLRGDGYDGVVLRRAGRVMLFPESASKAVKVDEVKFRNELEMIWEGSNKAKAVAERETLDQALAKVRLPRLAYDNKNGSREVAEDKYRAALQAELDGLAEGEYYAEHGQTRTGEKFEAWDRQGKGRRPFIDFVVEKRRQKVAEMRLELDEYGKRRAVAEGRWRAREERLALTEVLPPKALEKAESEGAAKSRHVRARNVAGSLEDALAKVRLPELAYEKRFGKRRVPVEKVREALVKEEGELARAVHYAKHGVTVEGERVPMYEGVTDLRGRPWGEWEVDRRQRKIDVLRAELTAYEERCSQAEREWRVRERASGTTTAKSEKNSGKDGGVRRLRLAAFNKRGWRYVSKKAFLAELAKNEEALGHAEYYKSHGQTKDGKKLTVWDVKDKDGRPCMEEYVVYQQRKVGGMRRDLEAYLAATGEASASNDETQDSNTTETEDA